MEHLVDLRGFTRRPIRPLSIVDRTCNVNPAGEAIDFTNAFMTVGGRPFLGVSGEFHFSRMDASRWDGELAKCAAGGVTVISTYVFWNHHEEVEGRWDFTGSRDLRRFVELCARHGLYVILRMGPFDHGEVRNGGLPDWVYGKDYVVRSLDPGWLAETRELYGRIAEQVDGLFYAQGGPIIAAQLDNEYMHSCAPWEATTGISDEWVSSGSDGVAYMEALRDIARESGVRVPFFTATAWGGAAVPDDVLPLWGGYAYRPWLFYAHGGEHPKTDEYLYRDFRSDDCPRNAEFDPSYPPSAKPYACCEMGGGMMNSYNYRFTLPMKSVDAMANVKLGSGCNFLGYYMYHGGTNPTGRGVYLNEGQVPKKSYDYQCGLGEFGQVRESYGRMRVLHHFVNAFGDRLAPMDVALPADQAAITPQDLDALRYSVRTDGRSGFVFLVNFQDHADSPAKRGESIRIVLPDGDDCAGSTVQFDGIGLAAGENCVLPFHMDLDGVTLEAATVQPVTAIRTPGTNCRTFVFMRPDGMDRAWMRFASEGSAHEIAVDGETDFQRFTVHGDAAACVEIVVVSRALACRMTVLDGEALAFAPDADADSAGSVPAGDAVGPSALGTLHALYRRGEAIVAQSCNGHPVTAVTTYPAGYLEPVGGTEAWADRTSATPAVTALATDRFAIDLPDWVPDALEGVAADVLLRVRYTGNIGWLFAGGRLLSDNFCNGDVWEIGLRDSAEAIRSAGGRLVLVITPLKKGVNVNVDSPMAARLETAAERIASLDGVELRPVCETVFRKDIVSMV